ncbi:MAG TPA: sigma-70 family RNA polymerase sigma factor, partial [Thermomicrobiales bacterium]|nr:sigma-70 family RNA polymerase sigma factor [Thermomicrobiales bacterium]
VARHERAVYSVALRHLRSPDAAQDVTQDAFLRAWQSLDSFRSEHPGGFRAWVLRIAANRALDTLRASARRPEESIDARQERDDRAWEPESSDESAVDLVSRSELSGVLERALGQLQHDQRLAVILSDVQGHPYDEIAGISGVALGTVKSRINRGRARLREILLADEAGRELLGRPARQESGDRDG